MKEQLEELSELIAEIYAVGDYALLDKAGEYGKAQAIIAALQSCLETEERDKNRPWNPEECCYEFDDFQNFWQNRDHLVFGQSPGEMSFEHRCQDYIIRLDVWPSHYDGLQLMRLLGVAE